MKTSLLLQAFALTIPLLAPAAGSAEPILPSRLSVAIAETCPNSGGGLFCDSGATRDSQQSDGFVSASVSGDLGGTMSTASGSGDSEFGTLRAAASTSFFISGTPQRIVGYANSGFWDVLTVDLEPWAGAQGTMLVDYTLDALLATSGVSNGLASVVVGVTDGADTTDPFQFNTDVYFSSFSGVARVPRTFTITFGQPFALFVALVATVGTFEVAPIAEEPGFTLIGVLMTGQGAGTVDAADTLFLSGLGFRDPLGNDVTNQVRVTAASGTHYRLAAAPEPSSLLLLATSLVIGWSRSRRSSARCWHPGKGRAPRTRQC